VYKPEQYLITAGGKIKCKRCQARSSRKKQQCGKPAMRAKNVCDTHGGLSTGPRTQEGIKRIQNAHWKHGNETKEVRTERSAKSLQFLMLEKIGWHIGVFAEGSTKFRGRKPKGYPYNLTNLNDDEQLAKAIDLSTTEIK
jgi:hypothetical protein